MNFDQFNGEESAYTYERQERDTGGREGGLWHGLYGWNGAEHLECPSAPFHSPFCQPKGSSPFARNIHSQTNAAPGGTQDCIGGLAASGLTNPSRSVCPFGMPAWLCRVQCIWQLLYGCAAATASFDLGRQKAVS